RCDTAAVRTRGRARRTRRRRPTERAPGTRAPSSALRKSGRRRSLESLITSSHSACRNYAAGLAALTRPNAFFACCRLLHARAEPCSNPGAMKTKLAASLARAEAALARHALAYPQVTEDAPWGHRAFKVKGKTFLFLATDGGELSLSTKLPNTG